MPANHHPARRLPVPGVVVGGTTQVPLREQRIIVPALVQLNNNGLEVPGCDHHLMVVDVPNGVAWRVPIPDRLVRDLHAATAPKQAGE